MILTTYLVRFGTFVDEQHARLEYTPKSCPFAQRATYFEPVSHDDNSRIFERADELRRRALLLIAIRLLLHL